MTPEEWKRVREVFEAVLDRDPGDRPTFLDQACAGDSRLRSQVTSLLEAHARTTAFIEAPAFETAAHLLVDEPRSSLEGRVVGPYIVRHEIGRGGMGVVYLADDTRLSRRVALKALPPSVSRDTARRERLRQEARAAAALTHPGIATVYALEEIGDELYLSCEYVPGQTLRQMRDAGPIPMAQVIDIALQLARALAAAHTQGVVHRDLKAENVIRTPSGVVKILDFGIARVDNLAPARLTEQGTVLGTPGYMAPEQARGQRVDFRSDLFSFGVLVYELAAGSNPFGGETVATTVARILESDPPPLSMVWASSLPTLDRILETCLRKDPADRYKSTADLVADLERLQTEVTAGRERVATGGGRPNQGAEIARGSTPRWWWQFHQLTVSTIYVLMMYPAWRVRSWLPPPWGMLFLLAVLACAAATTTIRLHLWFTSRFYPTELGAQRGRALAVTRSCDAGFAASLVLAALAIGDLHPEIAMLLTAVSIAAAVASFMIEPTTARAAFRANS